MTGICATDLSDLFDFAWIQDFHERLAELANLAEPEDWEYHNTPSQYPRPILYSYIRYTYARLAEEGKIGFSGDGKYACFNTGLVTPSQEAIYAFFEVNRLPDRQPWFFKGWHRAGEAELSKFANLPEIAHYFDDPSILTFDTRKELRVDYKHIVEDNRSRFPAECSEMDDYQLQLLLRGAIDHAKERVQRSYKTAIPQYHQGRIQLLLPLCLCDRTRADLALVIDRYERFYRAVTCLTLDMAYNNARLIARPEREWLRP